MFGLGIFQIIGLGIAVAIVAAAVIALRSLIGKSEQLGETKRELAEADRDRAILERQRDAHRNAPDPARPDDVLDRL